MSSLAKGLAVFRPTIPFTATSTKAWKGVERPMERWQTCGHGIHRRQQQSSKLEKTKPKVYINTGQQQLNNTEQQTKKGIHDWFLNARQAAGLRIRACGGLFLKRRYQGLDSGSSGRAEPDNRGRMKRAPSTWCW